MLRVEHDKAGQDIDAKRLCVYCPSHTLRYKHSCMANLSIVIITHPLELVLPNVLARTTTEAKGSLHHAKRSPYAIVSLRLSCNLMA